MGEKTKGRRPASASQGPSKKRKISTGKKKPNIIGSKKRPEGQPKNEKAADRGIIPIPALNDDVDLSDEELELFEEFGNAASFLTRLDHNGIMRSAKETSRLHSMNKPLRAPTARDDLPALVSSDEEEEEFNSWSSGIEDVSLLSATSNHDNDLAAESSSTHEDSDQEMPYETLPRKQQSWDAEKKQKIERLPIKLANGNIQSLGAKTMAPSKADTSGEDSEEEDKKIITPPTRDDISTGARFGRPAILDIIRLKSKHERLTLAKEQIASICQEILADPENSLGLLRRLQTFSLKTIITPTHPEPVLNDPTVRKLAVLSQLAVFKDIIPGYRIRALTEKEKTEKVGQMVARTREWEQGLVSIYQAYLRILENDLKEHNDLAHIALYCMCTLLTEVTHFNFRINLMTCIVARLSKKSWNKSSDLCLKTLVQVFCADLTGAPSFEVVRLLNRMVKERQFRIHPEVLSCLLHLRLRTELGVRASDSAVDRPVVEKGKRSKKQKQTERPHLSKKAKKTLKEKKEIDKELQEAEAEVDKEERATTQTETLKLLFTLYFRILKNPTPTPLLPAALSGISKFAHLVNIDFFKDLLKVLKDLILLDTDVEEQDMEMELTIPDMKDYKQVSHRLLCIVTAFELLSGQGEALNLDLSEFITRLYALISPLTLIHDIDTALPSSLTYGTRLVRNSSLSDMLFRALNIVLTPHTAVTTPPWRTAAFAKRLLAAALHWPPRAAQRALEFVHALVAKDATLEALLTTDDRIFDGVYRPEVDDPQLCHPFGTSFFELHVLEARHWDLRVREQARVLLKHSQR